MVDTIPININYELQRDSERRPLSGASIDWCAFNEALGLHDEFK